MTITLDGTTGITTPGLTNTGTETLVNLTTTGNTTLGDATTDTLTVGVTGIVKDASGNVGIGTASPAAKLDVRGSSTFLVNATNPTAWVSVDSALTTGSIYNQWNTTSSIGISGTYTNHPYTFVTNNTERMRIDSSGNLLVGTTSTVQSALLSALSSTTTAGFRTSAAAGSGLVIDVTRTSATGDMIYFRTSSTTLAGYITCPTGTTTSYLSVSDYRLKENITPMTGALEKISALKPCTYTWKADGVAGQGFIAHELQAVVPDCVVGIKDAVNEDGSIKPQGVDTSFLVATLTAALQEMKAIIDTQASTITQLTNRITALESK